ncbi:DNA-3-methyladenine glycosylase 2 family protein [Actinotalea ferrariae]|uniref:DNA-3-methyladenine glycosylase family protein n=1 Tax=Actinotalea ferrariae TaxID=1386098 RepID=UPI001C8BF6F0|nr:DNA-3-methyladenine glycosylase 2 family protein [Actinotalea ferrariae]MBX9245198.1 DNA-3-methyladenine glycosylase 2 family protein [Actinotalea ferrariae]
MEQQSVVTLAGGVDLHPTLAPLRRGFRDPAYRTGPDGAVWRATLLASGPATVRLQQRGPCDVAVTAWGPGAAEALAAAPAMLGAHDDASTFDPPAGPVRDAFRRAGAVRIPRTGRVLEALVPAILEQRVITRTAQDAWAYLLRAHGSPAPGPAPDGMRVPPSAAGWAQVPVWDFHRAGVDPRRARAVVAAARIAHRLEETVRMAPLDALARLTVVPGVGAWTAAETAQRALGDADAVSVGDYHLSGQVGWALTGAKVDDAGMLELLEPYRPHRYRAVRLLLLSGAARVPRRGPRLTVEDHRRR